MGTATKPQLLEPLTHRLRLDLSRVESGIPLAIISDFVASSGIPLKDIYDVVIPARTLKHRRDRKEPLSRDESDKLARLVRIYDQAVKAFGEPGRALLWLNRTKRRFDERTPVQMLQTELGGRQVEEMLGQIEYGMFA